MRVCLVSSFFPPYVGGIETYVSNLASGLAKRGHDVTVYCSSLNSSPGEVVVDGVRLVRFPTPLLLYGTPIGFLPSSLVRGEHDLMHSNFPGPYLAATSAWIGKVRRIPSVLTWHNDLPGVTPAASFLARTHDYLSPSYLDHYRFIIATSSIYTKRSRTLRNYSDKVRVVLNGVDTQRFRPSVEGAPVREKYGLERSYVILFVGALTRWHSYKGLDVLIEAFARANKRVPAMELVVVGGGELLQSYRSLASSLKVADKVHFAGYVADSILPRFYAASDVTVLPSKNFSEGFGLALLEAMSCGRAVIGTRVGGIPELIRDGENGLLIEPNDPEALAAALNLLYEQEQRRLEMGKAGRAFAELHDWKRVAADVESIYRDTS